MHPETFFRSSTFCWYPKKYDEHPPFFFFFRVSGVFKTRFTPVFQKGFGIPGGNLSSPNRTNRTRSLLSRRTGYRPLHYTCHYYFYQKTGFLADRHEKQKHDDIFIKLWLETNFQTIFENV